MPTAKAGVRQLWQHKQSGPVGQFWRLQVNKVSVETVRLNERTDDACPKCLVWHQ